MKGGVRKALNRSPFYAEMSSINPVFLLPAALAARAERPQFRLCRIADHGEREQLCTNPGLILALDGPDLERSFRRRARIERECRATMLTPAFMPPIGKVCKR